ncbi:hypothetical protein B0H13DRAFT_2339865 [Mycena leptocephala]|nr:hypothetical protein B0H13DRAFT_2339865 [Mycena leptocephala]
MAREHLPFHCAPADVMTSSAVAQRHSAPLPRRPPEDLKPLSSRTAACRLQRSNRCGTSLRMATAPLLPRPPHPRPSRGPPPPQTATRLRASVSIPNGVHVDACAPFLRRCPSSEPSRTASYTSPSPHAAAASYPLPTTVFTAHKRNAANTTVRHEDEPRLAFDALSPLLTPPDTRVARGGRVRSRADALHSVTSQRDVWRHVRAKVLRRLHSLASSTSPCLPRPTIASPAMPAGRLFPHSTPSAGGSGDGWTAARGRLERLRSTPSYTRVRLISIFLRAIH